MSASGPSTAWLRSALLTWRSIALAQRLAILLGDTGSHRLGKRGERWRNRERRGEGLGGRGAVREREREMGREGETESDKTESEIKQTETSRDRERERCRGCRGGSERQRETDIERQRQKAVTSGRSCCQSRDEVPSCGEGTAVSTSKSLSGAQSMECVNPQWSRSQSERCQLL